MTPRAAPPVFPWVQALRAAASFSVAFLHMANDAVVAGRDPTGLIAGLSRAMPWNAGVDIFFVISGFVIVHASAGLFGSLRGAARFLSRRLTRIVPLYWLLTTLFLAILAVQRSTVHGDIGGVGYILASYLFIPWARPDGLVEPALGLGWTLNYEMYFYLVLTPFLLLSRGRAVAGSAGVLCLMVAARPFYRFAGVQLAFWADPIILEFAVGMGLAMAVAAGLTLPGWLRVAMMAIAVAAFHLDASAAPNWRAVAFGLPSALLVCAAVAGPGQTRIGPAMGVLMRLGDASYAMYLFHPFVMRGFTVLESRINASTETVGVLYMLLGLLAAQICALAINAGFEQKMTVMLRRPGC